MDRKLLEVYVIRDYFDVVCSFFFADSQTITRFVKIGL